MILAEEICMAYSGMLYWVDISRFYFYEPLLFQIFVLWKFIKNQVFPYLLSLLQSTAMQITISIYKYIYLFPKLYSIKSVFFFKKIQVKVFYIQIWFKCETPLIFFSNKKHGLQKKLYSKNSFEFLILYYFWNTSV